MDHVNRIYQRFKTTTTYNAPAQFTEQICLSFLDDGNKDAINESIETLSKYQKSIYKYQNELLTLTGVGPEFHRVADISNEINLVVRWVEEIMCIAMVEPSEVVKMYQAREFEFQSP